MIAEHGLRRRGVILRTNGQNHATLSQLLGVALQGKVRFTCPGSLPEDDPFRPIITDHTAPQSVVEVEYEAFLRRSELGGDDSGEQVSVKRAQPVARFPFWLVAIALHRTRHPIHHVHSLVRYPEPECHLLRLLLATVRSDGRSALPARPPQDGHNCQTVDRRCSGKSAGSQLRGMSLVLFARAFATHRSTRPIAASASAAVAVSGTPAIASRAESESKTILGL